MHKRIRARKRRSSYVLPNASPKKSSRKSAPKLSPDERWARRMTYDPKTSTPDEKASRMLRREREKKTMKRRLPPKTQPKPMEHYWVLWAYNGPKNQGWSAWLEWYEDAYPGGTIFVILCLLLISAMIGQEVLYSLGVLERLPH